MRRQLYEHGEIRVGCGSFDLGFVHGSLYTGFGPRTQDKDTNQDYALAWWPHSDKSGTRVRFALALADGVTDSYRAEWGAALACWAALRDLSQANNSDEATAVGERAFVAAGNAIADLANELARDPRASCPEGQFLSTWRYMLLNGRLLETTLSLLWVEDERLCLAIVGDAGALWRVHDSSPSDQGRVLAQCDLATSVVRALGPRCPTVVPFDCWGEESLSDGFLCTLFTDGIGRSLGTDPLMILDDLDKLEAAAVPNQAHSYIEQALADRPEQFDDNVTLAIVRGKL